MHTGKCYLWPGGHECRGEEEAEGEEEGQVITSIGGAQNRAHQHRVHVLTEQHLQWEDEVSLRGNEKMDEYQHVLNLLVHNYICMAICFIEITYMYP